jgi:hypothetical protein
MENLEREVKKNIVKKTLKWKKKKQFSYSKHKTNFVEKKIYPFKRLKCIIPNDSKAISSSDLKCTKHFFLYDTLGNIPKNYFEKVSTKSILTDVNKFILIDEIHGCYGASRNGIPPFILIPRHQSLSTGPKEMIHQQRSLMKLVCGLITTKRGESKNAIYSRYTTFGAHAKRGSHGISYKTIKEKLNRDFHVVVNMVKKAEHCAENVLPSAVIDALKRTKDKFEWSGIMTTNSSGCKKEKSMLWASVATSYDYASAAHVDSDFFLSLLTVTTCEHTLKNIYELNQPIALFFMFPELGYCVGLRPGDQLIFNPLYYHCVSTKNFSVYENPVHVTSFYLKTAIVGRNDNRKELEAKLFK